MGSLRGEFLNRLQDELAELRKEVEIIEKKCAQKFRLLNRTSEDSSADTDKRASGLQDKKCNSVPSLGTLLKKSNERPFISRIPRSSSTTDRSSSEDLGSPAPRTMKFKSKRKVSLPRSVTSLGLASRPVDYPGYPLSTTSSSSYYSRETMSIGSGDFKCCNSPQSTLETLPSPQSVNGRRVQPGIVSRDSSLETSSIKWGSLDCFSSDVSKIPRAPRPAHTPRCYSAMAWSESASLATRMTCTHGSSIGGGESPCTSLSSVGGCSHALLDQEENTSLLPSPPTKKGLAIRSVDRMKMRESYVEYNIGCL